MERRAGSGYGRSMPNRKTFDVREKYDHSGRSVQHAKKNDLKPDISEEGPAPGDGDSPVRGDPLDSRDKGNRRARQGRAAGR